MTSFPPGAELLSNQRFRKLFETDLRVESSDVRLKGIAGEIRAHRVLADAA
jgi:hypothetical protein